MIDFISQTSINQFLRCPKQWEFRWVEGIIIPPRISARRGSGVHKAAAHNFTQKKTTLEDEPLTVLQDVARDEYVRLVKEEGVFIPKDELSAKTTLLNEGLNAAVALTKVFREELAPQIEPVIVEERLEVDAGVGIPIYGTLDLTTVEEELHDIKTADKSKGKNEAHNSLQLTLYSGLYREKFKKWPKKLKLDVLVNTKEPKLQPLETTRGQEEWDNLIVRIRLMLAQIETGIFTPCSPDSWCCSRAWCGYFEICPYSLKRRS